MYIPSHFEIVDQQEMMSFISGNAFGQLFSTVAGRPFSSHLPFLISDDNSQLLTHLARPNPQHSDVEGSND